MIFKISWTIRILPTSNVSWVNSFLPNKYLAAENLETIAFENQGLIEEYGRLQKERGEPEYDHKEDQRKWIAELWMDAFANQTITSSLK